MSDWNERNKKVIAEFRENGGVVGGHFENFKLLLLHTTGAKSGLKRVTPLVTKSVNNKWIIIASKGGAPTHPDWYYNLVANPEVYVEVGTEEFATKAVITEEPERTELYEKMEESYSFFTDYKKKAGRVIPVITLEE